MVSTQTRLESKLKLHDTTLITQKTVKSKSVLNKFVKSLVSLQIAFITPKRNITGNNLKKIIKSPED